MSITRRVIVDNLKKKIATINQAIEALESKNEITPEQKKSLEDRIKQGQTFTDGIETKSDATTMDQPLTEQDNGELLKNYSKAFNKYNEHISLLRSQITINKMAEVQDLNDRSNLELLNRFANCQNDPARANSIISNEFKSADPDEKINQKQTTALLTAAQTKLKELAPEHIRSKIRPMNLDKLTMLGELLEAKPNDFRRLLNHYKNFFDIDLSQHLNDQTIIDNKTIFDLQKFIAEKIAYLIKIQLGEKIGSSDGSGLGLNLANPEQATILAALATADSPEKMISIIKQLVTSPDAVLKNDLVLAALKLPSFQKVAQNRIENQLIHSTLDSISRINLSGADDEIKNITTLASIANREFEAMRTAIAALKDKLGIVNNLEPAAIESQYIVSDDVAKNFQDQLRKKLQSLMKANVNAAFLNMELKDLSLSFALITNDADLRQLREIIKQNRAALGLKGFVDAALDNPAVLSDDFISREIVEKAKQHRNNLMPTSIQNAITAIKTRKITNSQEAEDLASLAVCTKTQATQRTLLSQKNNLGEGLKYVDVFQNMPPERSLVTTARETIQQEITQTVEDKLRTLTPPESATIINAIDAVKGDEAKTVDALILYKKELGLTHLDDNYFKNKLIITSDMITRFTTLASDLKSSLDGPGKIVSDALTALQTRLPDPLSSEYKTIKDRLWNNPATRNELIALAEAKDAVAGATPGERATNLAASLREQFSAEGELKNETEIKAALEVKFPRVTLDNVAASIYQANLTESQTKKIKAQVAEFKTLSEKITKMHKEAKALAAEAKTKADEILPATLPAAVEKLAEAKKAEDASTALEAKAAAANTAYTEAATRFNNLTNNRTTTANAFTAYTQAQTDNANALEEAENQHKIACEASAIATARVMAKKPEEIKINPDIGRVTPGAQLNIKDKRELASCERLKELYRVNYLAKEVATQDHPNIPVLKDLPDTISNVAKLIQQIDLQLTSVHADGSALSDPTKRQLEELKRDFETLHMEMKQIHTDKGQKTRPPLDAIKQVQVFPRLNAQKQPTPYTSTELRNIHKNPEKFATWLNNIRGFKTVSDEKKSLFTARAGNDSYNPQFAKSNLADEKKEEYKKDIYRVSTPDTANMKETEMLWYEHEFQEENAAESNLELVVIDLPKAISDRGILLKYLENELKITQKSDGTPLDSNELHDMVFELPSSLTEKAVSGLLAKLNMPFTPGFDQADHFINKYLPAKQYTKQKIYEKYEKKTKAFYDPAITSGPAANVLTREEYLNKSPAEQKEFEGTWGSSSTVTLPAEPFFYQAGIILNTLLARGYEPYEISEIRNGPLLIAIDCLARNAKIVDKLIFPSDAIRATDKQVAAVAPIFPLLKSMETTRNAITKTQAATDDKKDTDVGRDISQGRAPEAINPPRLGK